MSVKGVIPIRDLAAVDSDSHFAIDVGTGTLDGTNPTPITTKLNSITAAVAFINESTAPGDDTHMLSCVVSGGTLNVYAWKPTSGTDPTLVASDGEEDFMWIAIGT